LKALDGPTWELPVFAIEQTGPEPLLTFRLTSLQGVT